MQPSRVLMVRAQTGCAAATGEGDTRACKTFIGVPMLFTAGLEDTDDATLNAITGGEKLVVNQSTSEVVAGNVYQAVQEVGGFWIVLESGGSGSMVVFEFDSDEYSPEDPPDRCADKSPADAASHKVFVTNTPCGGSVQGIDEDGYITVADPGEFLKDRDYRDLPGRTGFAQLVGGSGEYGDTGCQWVITWINFFREITIIQNIIFQEDRIVLKRKKIVVWDDCSLPDEEILGADCDPDEYV